MRISMLVRGRICYFTTAAVEMNSRSFLLGEAVDSDLDAAFTPSSCVLFFLLFLQMECAVVYFCGCLA